MAADRLPSPVNGVEVEGCWRRGSSLSENGLTRTATEMVLAVMSCLRLLVVELSWLKTVMD